MTGSPKKTETAPGASPALDALASPDAAAKALMDLWEKQSAAWLADPTLAQMTASWLELWKNWANAGQAINSQGGNAAPNLSDTEAAAAAAGSWPFAAFQFPALAKDGLAAPFGTFAFPQPSDRDELLCRLAACEKRIAALEQRLDGRGPETVADASDARPARAAKRARARGA